MTATKDGSVTISKGTQWVLGISLTLLLFLFGGATAWASTVKTDINAINTSLAVVVTELANTSEQIEKSTAQLAIISDHLTEHITDPAIHHAKISELQAKIDALERQVERMERERD